MRVPSLPSTLLLGAVASLSASAQFVTPPADSVWTHKTGYAGVPVRYKEVPSGICETQAGVKSYSGYAEVEPGSYLFFWFFEARHGNASDAPLTVWTNGGPGSSSMIGLFQELGPCRIDKDGNVVNNPYAWNEVSNMLFLDQPVATGFSYASPTPAYISSSGNIVTLPNNTCPDFAQGLECGTYSQPNVSTTVNSTEAGARSFYRAIQGFMGALPQYARESFGYATESYGGHYGSIYTRYILEQNAKAVKGTKKIQFDSLLIGNGWYDPAVQYEAYYNFTLENYYDIHPYNASVSAQVRNALYGKGNCLDQIKECYRTGVDSVCSTADSFCASEVESVWDTVAMRDEYDARELTPDPFPPTFYVDYLNTPKVQQAIGAYTNFSESSITVGAAFSSTGDDGREEGTIEDLRAIIEAGVFTVLYVGDADYNCNIFGGMVVADKIKAPSYSDAGYTRIKYGNKSQEDAPGEVRQSGNFAFVRVYQSGHEVPFFAPRIGLEMLRRVLERKDIATGLHDISSSYRTSGPKVSTYREGNSTVQYEILPTDATYNTTTGAPNPYNKTEAASSSSVGASKRGSSAARFALQGQAKAPKGGKHGKKASNKKKQSALLRFAGRRAQLRLASKDA